MKFLVVVFSALLVLATACDSASPTRPSGPSFVGEWTGTATLASIDQQFLCHPQEWRIGYEEPIQISISPAGNNSFAIRIAPLDGGPSYELAAWPVRAGHTAFLTRSTYQLSGGTVNVTWSPLDTGTWSCPDPAPQVGVSGFGITLTLGEGADGNRVHADLRVEYDFVWANPDLWWDEFFFTASVEKSLTLTRSR